ncbi:MAG: sodium/solute symporter [Verrucomicrobia bacterium]|nr:sodium/solute symporter [Verrucomicrobiota bacterium]
MAGMGWYFRRRSRTTEQYFVGGRAYPGWLLGVSLFGAAISSITFVGYPADAFKTAYLRYLICLTLPVGVFIVARWFLPMFRRARITSVFEYLESRFGPRVRVYGASVFIIAQLMRISLIQYLVSLLVHYITGWNVTSCIVVGGAITAYYTVVGGIEAVIWTDFVQSVILTAGGLLILGVILLKLPGGLGQLISVASDDGKFMLGDLDPADGRLHPAPWDFALSHKTVLMLVLVGVFQWLGEYTTNQEVVQKYCAAKSTRDARQALWISCWICLPTWGYFMFVGTGLYVFYKIFPDPQVADMLSGARRAEEVLPYFVTTQLPAGFSGIVVAAVLAAAMSSMSSAMNSISAVIVTDIYRRHLAAGRNDGHYVRVAKLTTLGSSIIMLGGAIVLAHSEARTLQHFYTEFTSIIAGGLLGLYLLGFFTTRGDERAVLLGIVFAAGFSAVISFAGLGWLPASFSRVLESRFDSYYTGLVSNLLMFVVGFALAGVLSRRPRDLTNLTIWTQDRAPLD